MANEKQLKILKQGVRVWNEWRMEHSDVSVDLRHANLLEVSLDKIFRSGVDLHEANLYGAILVNAKLRGANLYGANLSEANLVRIDLREADLRRSDLRQTKLSGADLIDANLSEAILIGSDLRLARLLRADLRASTLTGTYLYGAACDDWKIDGVICDYAYWDSIGMQRTPRSRNFYVNEFEESCKQRYSILKEPAQDVKVFICYAREDMAFAKRIYQDLKRVPGVRPWIDTEDLQLGQVWEQVITYELQHSSYVLALLSSHSLNKIGYVRKELKDALRLMELCPPDATLLIPVRLEAIEPKEEELRQLQWCDLFESYEKGITQILKVICPGGFRVRLRSEPVVVSRTEFRDVFGLNGHDLPLGYIRNEYEKYGDIIFDHTTGLTWQKSGSPDNMTYPKAQEYIETLNQQQFAGFHDWRLPTVPELMSLFEPEKQANGLYIDPIFDATQSWCWSADRLPEGSSSSVAWPVFFNYGYVNLNLLDRYTYVRAVRP